MQLGHSDKFLLLYSMEKRKSYRSGMTVEFWMNYIYKPFFQTSAPSRHLTEWHFISGEAGRWGQSSTETGKKYNKKKTEQREVFPQDRSNHWKPDRGENQTDVAVMWNSRNAVPSAGRTNCTRWSQGWRNQMAMENQHWVLFFLMAIINQVYKQCQWRWRNSLTLIFHIWYEKPEWRSSALHAPPQTNDLPIYTNRVITAKSKISNIIATCIVNLHRKRAPLLKSSRGR